MLAYLLTATLVICAAPLVAQEQSLTLPDSARITNQQTLLPTAPANSAETSVRTDRSTRDDLLRQLTSGRQFLDDTMCYTMRTYVVARDGKHSDSVHPVGYSTCQPAGKYRLRTTQMDFSGR